MKWLTLWASLHCRGLSDFFGPVQQVYTEGTGQYTDAFGVAAYQSEHDPTATFVPVELEGGPGTADSHWDDLFDVTDSLGRPLARELMVAYDNPPMYISNTTVQSFADIGFLPTRFTSNPTPLPNLTPDSASVPEPGTTRDENLRNVQFLSSLCEEIKRYVPNFSL